MAKKFKQSKGNKYAHNAEYTDEALRKNVKQPAQNNPSEGARSPF